MKMRASILKRSDRLKKTKGLDEFGSQKVTRVKGGWFFRILYKDRDGQPRTEEKGPFPSKLQVKDSRDRRISTDC